MSLILILLILIPLLLLALPIRITIRGTVSDPGPVSETQPAGDCHVRLLLGALGGGVTYEDGLTWFVSLFSLRVLKRPLRRGVKDQKKEDEDEEEEAEVAAEKPRKRLIDQLVLIYGYVTRFKSPVLRLLRRLMKTVWLRRLEIDGRLGAGAPDTTGKLFGLVYAAGGVTGKRARIDVQPDFLKAGFSGTIKIEAWFWLGFVLWSVGAAAVVIGGKFGVWYLKQKLGRLRRPRHQTA